MHKSGSGLVGALVLGLLLSPHVLAALQTPSTGTSSSTAPASADASAATQPAADTSQATSPTSENSATPSTSQNAVPPVPATPQPSPKPPAAKIAPVPDQKAPSSSQDNAGSAGAEKTAPVEKPAAKPAPAEKTESKPAPAEKTESKPAPAEKPVKKSASAEKTTVKSAQKKNAEKAAATAKESDKTKPAAKATDVRTFKVSACPDLNAIQVADLIKQDYTENRFPRFEDDKQALGSDNIVAWVNPEDVTGTGDDWQAPLQVRGAAADRSYQVSLDCQKGEISYSLKK
ncbi:protein YebF [Martelella alba]|uniref:Uncharacterized protein n=1 Tax=Martelella alba TaxID=2590451 RepID=A0ABY2SR67_9HYPH|nr:protein YebF [Martelella alba]TKI08231.1 hypothetical protein FCN80_03525 [Martelella alba]